MNEHLQCLLNELIEALGKMPNSHYLESLEKAIPSLKDGTFFQMDPQIQKEKLIWLNAAYFGRGDVGRPLLQMGCLRREFPEDFQIEINKYLSELE